MGGYLSSGAHGDGGGTQTTPAGPGRSCARPSLSGSLIAALQPKGRDSTLISIKLVKMTKCHRNMSKRPSLVPNSQNGSRKSPLDFLRFYFSAAFSHKELLDHFEPTTDFIVKTAKCRQVVHRNVTRSGRSDTPTATQQAASVAAPHLSWRGCRIDLFL